MAFNYQNVEILDFSGGITDKYINAPINKYKKADNFVITRRGLETRSGFEVAYEQEALLRIMSLWLLNNEIYTFRGQALYRFNYLLGTLTLVSVPNGNTFFEYSGSDVYPNASEWKDQLLIANTGQVSPLELNYPMRVYIDDAGVIKTHELGLPAYPSGNTFIPAGAAGAAKHYDYALIYEFTYNIGNTEFKMASVPYYKLDYQQANDINGGNGVNIAVFQTLSGALNRVDVANVKIGIYRTVEYTTAQDGVYYKVGEVSNGFAGTFTDTATDAALVSGATLYVSSGEVEHYKPPKCRYIFAVNDVIYYLYALEELASGDVLRPYRFYQSIPATADAFDPSFFKDVDDEIVGGSHVNGVPIILTKTFIYRVEGTIDRFGSGNIRTRIISDSAGCLNHNGIIRTGDKLFFAGLNGFYVTDGFKVTIIPASLELTESYRTVTNTDAKRAKICGTYDRFHERIIWSMGTVDSDNNRWWVLDLITGGLTTCSGDSFISSAVLHKDEDTYRADNQGYIYKHNDSFLNDVVRDVNEPVANWITAHIPFDYISAALDFGNPHVRKWVKDLTISVTTEGKASYGLESINDDGRSTKPMKEVKSINTLAWDDPNFVWGDPDFIWRMPNTITKTRHFPRGMMRCRRKQVRILPKKVNLFKSDLYGTVDIAYTVPLNPSQLTLTGILNKFPEDIEFDFILFEEENYLVEHTILSRTDSTLIVSGGGSVTTGNDKKWIIKGYNRKQKFELNYLSISFTPMDNIADKFKSKEEGGNA